MLYLVDYCNEETLETWGEEYSVDTLLELQIIVSNVLQSEEVGTQAHAHIYQLIKQPSIDYRNGIITIEKS